MRQRGFTLIELLVVIAVIGILASVILASLNSAREKGSDAAVKANMASIRSQAELYYDIYGRYRRTTNGTDYDGTCDTSSTVFGDNAAASTEVATVINNAIHSAYDAAGGVDRRCRTPADGSAYMIAIKTASGPYWCIDSVGAAKSIGNTLPATGIFYCP